MERARYALRLMKWIYFKIKWREKEKDKRKARHFGYYYRQGVRTGWRTVVFDMKLIKKKKTRTAFLSSYRNTSGSLGERKMLWEREPQVRTQIAQCGIQRVHHQVTASTSQKIVHLRTFYHFLWTNTYHWLEAPIHRLQFRLPSRSPLPHYHWLIQRQHVTPGNWPELCRFVDLTLGR